MREIEILGQEVKPESYLSKLWRAYRFMGEAPLEGAPAATRLYEACKQYVDLAMGRRTYSDSAKKALHDQIAVMTTGQSRHGMSSRQAEAVANFASEYVHGFKLDEAEKYQEPIAEY